MGLPWYHQADGKESACNAEDKESYEGSIPGPGRSPEEGNGNPLQYFFLGNSMDRGSWRATVRGDCKQSDTTEHTCTIHNSFIPGGESLAVKAGTPKKLITE